MIRKLTLAAVLAGTTALAALTPANAEMTVKELNFGIISTESSQNLKSVWDPFLKDMEKQIGVPVKAFFAPDYAGIIQAMRFGKVDIAWYGNKSAMEAVDRANGEIFVQTVAADGSPGYWSLLITHKDHKELNSVQDVLKNAKDLTFGNGDPNSTSGFLVPSYYVFAVNNVDAKQAFKRMVTANHETNAMAVANKQVDVATNNTESMDRLKINQPDKFEQIKVVWKSPLIPSDPIVWRKDLPDADKQELKSFFLDYGTKSAEEKKVLAGLAWAPFKESSNNQLLPIRQLELFRTKTKLQADESMAADEKKAKMAEIDAQLAALEKQMATN
ncbi:phosphonate transport system substrate-binding protein [Constrictibacter sp. MBR-5]|jgi:phosphonate transport system substrate-binding protein|uniref:phosphonate ABC transporter substrate-binding protein n=1 Tax=Constrictibacter sp. MBR-5 TaxID=3156467 RepID=UPI003391274C